MGFVRYQQESRMIKHMIIIVGSSVFAFSLSCANAKLQVTSLVKPPEIEKDFGEVENVDEEIVISGTCDPNTAALQVNVKDQKWTDNAGAKVDWIDASEIAVKDKYDFACMKGGTFSIVTSVSILETKGIVLAVETEIFIRGEYTNGRLSDPVRFVIKNNIPVLMPTDQNTDQNTEIVDDPKTDDVPLKYVYYVEGVLPISPVLDGTSMEQDGEGSFMFLPLASSMASPPNPLSMTGLKYFAMP